MQNSLELHSFCGARPDALGEGRPKAEHRKSGPLRKNVLVVDDEAAVRDLLKTLLARLGHSCQTAGSGADALSWMGASHFDLLITDLRMPEMDGGQLALESKYRSPA